MTVDWTLAGTVLTVGVALTISIALIGSVITALQITKFNALRKAFQQDQKSGIIGFDEIVAQLKEEK